MSTAEISLWHRISRTRLRDAIRGRFDASLDWRRIIAEAELPAELADMVAATVRATRLRRSEKVDVARELIAHFQDGLDAGRTPDQLIDSFGDLLHSGRLIRRAKKRGRSLAWHVWHYGWLTFAGLIVVYVVTGLYMLTQRPSITTDFLAIVNERALAVPEAERAWPMYREALLALGPKTTPGEYYPESVIPHIEAKPGEEAWPQVEQMLREHSEAVAKLRAAAGRRGLGFVPATSFAAFKSEDRQLFGVTVTDEERAKFQSETLEDRWLVSTLLPNLQQLRSAAHVLAADARRAAIDSDGAAALADVEAILGVSRHAQETPFLVCTLVADRVQRAACEVVQDNLIDQPNVWTDNDLRDLAHLIAASEIDWRRGFQGEKTNFYDVVQRLYTDTGDGDGQITNEGLQRIKWMISLLEPNQKLADTEWSPRLPGLAVAAAAPAGLFGMASRAEVAEVYERFMGQQEATFDRHLWELEAHSLENGLDGWSTIEKLQYLPITILLPTLSAARYSVETSRGMRDGVLAGIALELYRREHGDWPKSLDQLAPRWLPSVPIDRMTGGPLGYKIIDDRPVVYSVGVDRDDDGGRAPVDADGNSDSVLASPNHFELQPVADESHNGDWLIWSPPAAADKQGT